MGVVEFISDKAAGVTISIGLLIAGSWWAVNTYVRKDVDSSEGKRHVKIARYVMYGFLLLFLIKVVAGKSIAEMVRKRVMNSKAMALKMGEQMSKITGSPLAQVSIEHRKFLSKKIVTGGMLAGAISSIFLLETGNKEGDEARQIPVAIAFIIIMAILFYGQFGKDSVSGALAEAKRAVAAKTSAASS
tara:strand:- start:200 stop:763 length:564 start_codon:yes stop_codon:yes gene_type:complete